MDNLKYDLELLYELQNYDIKIRDIRGKINEAPYLVEEQKKNLREKKSEIEAKKKNFGKLNSLKKEKEAELDSKNKAIDKYSAELNAVKSNDAYKALLLEIEKTKNGIRAVEDEILDLMDRIDREFVVVKAVENELKEFERKIENEISELESSTRELEKEAAVTEKEREEYKLKVNNTILAQYERLCNGYGRQGICLIESESCGGCGMALRPQLINQAHKCRELVFCDNCSRILLKK